MGKKTKVGKARKDKFYKLAKETGYRARSAFKLIQLNRKYGFLEKSRVVVDLCAAPGGWLQVAAQTTPVSSLIIGVDLVSIRPIHKCTTFQADITTEKCRQNLKQELKTWKADVFLNDGAPNVGKNWVHDAYQQAELTLHAVKLSTEFLRKGGWFVTKVFRSKDYYSLLWVLQQLFQDVHATKPQASRNESAEIFVVCQGFLAPDKIDPKFLNPKHVFKEVEPETRQTIDLLHPEKKKRHREGYAEGDYTLYHTLAASLFLSSDNHLELLAGASEVVLDDKKVANHALTTAEVKECLKDIKVLGKKDIKGILTWRKKLREQLGMDCKPETEDAKKPVTAQKEEEEEDDEEQIHQQLEQLESAERRALKRKLKKTRREKAKLRHKMDLKIVLPNDKPELVDDIDLFDLKKIKNKKQLDAVDEGDLSDLDAELEWESEDDDAPQPSKRRMISYDREMKDYRDREDMSEDEYDSDPDLEDGDEEGPSMDIDEEERNPLVVDLQQPAVKRGNKVNSWFSKSSFVDVEDEDDEEVELDHIADTFRSREKTVKQQKKQTVTFQEDEDDCDSDDSGVADAAEKGVATDDEDDSSSDSDSDYDTAEIQPVAKHKDKVKNPNSNKKDGFDIVPADDVVPPGKLDEVDLAIGSALVQSRKRRREIIDGAYHRYMFDDDGLPDWFVKDEARHNRIQLPVSKGDIQEYKEKLKAVDARPIKKIAEAKARKKKKEVRRLERARKRAEVVTDNTEVSDKEKWQQIKQIYKKAGLLNKKKKEVTYVVAKKGTGKRVRRPAGVSGRFKVVDGRMKKDTRGEKRKMNMRKGGKKQKQPRTGRKKR